jgi:hypothetical protein
MFSSLLKSDSANAGNNKNREPTSSKQDIAEARKNARALLKQQTSQLKPIRDSIENCKNSNYYFYGYRLPTMLTLFGGSLVAQQKIPAIGHFGSIASLFFGWYIGGFFHQTHITWLQADLIRNIDKTIKILEQKDATVGTNIGLGDYREALDNLQRERSHTIADRAAANLFGFSTAAGKVDGEGAENGAEESGHNNNTRQIQVGPDGHPIQADPIEMETNRLIANYERRKKLAKNAA